MRLSYILLGLSMLFLTGCKFIGNGSNTLPPPLPVDPGPPPIIMPSRKGLYYGYFGTSNSQVEETLDHVNLLFEPAWDGIDAAIDRMSRSSLPTVFVISAQVYTGESWGTYLGKDTAQKNLRELFNKLRDYNVLKNVIGLYPVDEPELGKLTTEVITQVNADIREVMKEYSELENCKLVVTYTGNETYPGIESYDVIGFDDYDQREKIFEEGNKYDRLRNRLRDDQLITLFPGGSDPWRTNPNPFYAKAQLDSKVWAIIPFIWLDSAGGSSSKGIKSNGTAIWYSVCGQAIKNAK